MPPGSLPAPLLPQRLATLSPSDSPFPSVSLSFFLFLCLSSFVSVSPYSPPLLLSLCVSFSFVSVCRSPSLSPFCLCLSFSLSLSLLPSLLLCHSLSSLLLSISCLLYFEPHRHSKRNKPSGRRSFKANLFPVSKRKKSLSLLQSLCVQFFVTLWTIALQAPLSMEFSRQESWSGLPFPSPGDLPNPRIELRSPALQADSLPTQPSGKLP